MNKTYIIADSRDCIRNCSVCPYNEDMLYGPCRELNDFFQQEAEEDFDFCMNLEKGDITREYLWYINQKRTSLII